MNWSGDTAVAGQMSHVDVRAVVAAEMYKIRLIIW